MTTITITNTTTILLSWIEIMLQMVRKAIDAVSEALAWSDDFVGQQGFRGSVQLDGYTCGVHCVRSVLRHFGIRASHAQLKKEMRTNDEDGTKPGFVLQALRRRGLRAWSNNDMRMRDLEDILERGGVAIVDVDGDHYIVVYGISDRYVYVMDSILFGATTGRHTRKKFKERWDRTGINILPADAE